MYYDKPVVSDSVCAVIGSLGLTMQFRASVSNAPASVLMDSCCTNTLMSASYARQMEFTVQATVGTPLQVAVANAAVCSSIGTCKVRLSLQQFSADLLCTVVELADAYEVTLVEDWLSRYSATLSWDHRCCVLTKGSQRFTLVPETGSDSETPAPVGRGAYAALFGLCRLVVLLHRVARPSLLCVLTHSQLLHLVLLLMEVLILLAPLIGLD